MHLVTGAGLHDHQHRRDGTAPRHSARVRRDEGAVAMVTLVS
jgi:hypothetical protein